MSVAHLLVTRISDTGCQCPVSRLSGQVNTDCQRRSRKALFEVLGRLGIPHRRTAYHHPEGNSYLERFHRSLKEEEEVRTAEYRSLEEARESIARWIEEYNHDRPHRSLGDRTPREVFLGFGSGLRTEAVSVRI